MKAMFKQFFIKGFGLGAGLAAGAFATVLLAVTVSGTFNSWTDGQTLTSADLNANFSSLKSAIEAIPEWTKNGAEIIYTGRGSRVMAVSVQPGANTISVGSPVELFRNERMGAGDVSPNGQRALVAIGAELGESHPISIMLNWTEALRDR